MEEKKTAIKAEAGAAKKILIAVSAVAAVALIIAAVLIAGAVQKNNAYESAAALLEAGWYEEAIAEFTELGDYKDSVELILRAEAGIEENRNGEAYQDAAALLDAGSFGEALAAFEALGDYRDSAEQVCEVKYRWALACLEGQAHSDAYRLLTEVAEYKDAAAYLADFLYLPVTKTETEQDSDGKTAVVTNHYAYDSHGRVTEARSLKEGSESESITVYTYTDNADGSYSVEYGNVKHLNVITHTDYYDAEGRCIKEYTKSANSESWYDYEYYENGTYRKMTYTIGEKVSWEREYARDGTYTAINYNYRTKSEGNRIDAHNNIIKTGDTEYVYTYDDSGNMLRKEEYREGELVAYADYTYDEYGSLICTEGQKQSGDTYVNTCEYVYQYIYCPDAA